MTPEQMARLLAATAPTGDTPTALLGFLVDPDPLEATEPDDTGTVMVDLDGQIGWDIQAGDVARMMANIPSTATRLDVHLNSPGGNVWQGIKIGNVFRRSRLDVHVHVIGIAASAASVLAMGADRVVMHPGSFMMVHNARATVLDGTAPDLVAMAELVEKINTQMAELYAARAGGSAAEWAETMAAEEWFTAAEAVSAGLSDELAAGEPSDAEGAQAKAAAALACAPHLVYGDIPPELAPTAHEPEHEPEPERGADQPDPEPEPAAVAFPSIAAFQTLAAINRQPTGSQECPR